MRRNLSKKLLSGSLYMVCYEMTDLLSPLVSTLLSGSGQCAGQSSHPGFEDGVKLIFQTPPFEKRTDKKPHFSWILFSCEQNKHPNFKLDIKTKVLYIYRLIPRKPYFLEWLAIFDTTTICRFFGASRSAHGCIQHKSACFWVSVDIYALHCVACKI
jgi:hypothetical protein